jgi:hypothetical protein
MQRKRADKIEWKPVKEDQQFDSKEAAIDWVTNIECFKRLYESDKKNPYTFYTCNKHEHCNVRLKLYHHTLDVFKTNDIHSDIWKKTHKHGINPIYKSTINSLCIVGGGGYNSSQILESLSFQQEGNKNQIELPSKMQLQNRKQYISRSKDLSINTIAQFNNWCSLYSCTSKEDYLSKTPSELLVLESWDDGCLFSSKLLLSSISGL